MKRKEGEQGTTVVVEEEEVVPTESKRQRLVEETEAPLVSYGDEDEDDEYGGRVGSTNGGSTGRGDGDGDGNGGVVVEDDGESDVWKSLDNPANGGETQFLRRRASPNVNFFTGNLTEYIVIRFPTI